MGLYKNITNKTISELSQTVFSILSSPDVKNRIFPIMGVTEEIFTAAESVNVISRQDVSLYSPSLAFLTVGDNEELGYKIGDVLYLDALKSNPDAVPGDRPVYKQGGVWVTKNGYVITSEDSQKCIAIDVANAAASGTLFCASPYPTVSEYKAYWMQRVSKEYLPLEDTKDSQISFAADWGASKVDILTLNAYSTICKVLSEAASYSISHVDWINYRVYANIAETYERTYETAPEQYERLCNFVRRVLAPQDFSYISRITQTGAPLSFEEYALSAPPMDQLLLKILYKHIDAAAKSAKAVKAKKTAQSPAQPQKEEKKGWSWGFFNRFVAETREEPRRVEQAAQVEPDPKVQERAKLAAEIKHTLLLKDSLMAFCGSGSPELAKALLEKLEAFFELIETKEDFKIVEKLFEGAAGIRSTPEFLQFAEGKKKYYVELKNIPSNITQWLEDHTDAGAIMDVVAADAQYAKLVREAGTTAYL